MKIAFLSDVHANLPAVEAALAVAARVGAEGVVVAGDLVGEGPHPVEVIAAVRERGALCIRGNVDGQVLELALGGKKLKKMERGGKRQKRNRAWTALRLREAPESLEWLAALPAELRLEVEDRELLVVHGSPRGDTDYIFPSLTPAALAGKLEPLGDYRPSVLVCGHSHVPFAREVDGVLVVNCGSVGRPADGDPRGTMAVVDFGGPEGTHVQLVRFGFPVERVIADLAERGVPGMDPEEYRLGVKS
jgi:putative phosphoesterase